MKGTFLSLFAKFFIAIVLIVSVFGTLNLYVVSNLVSETINDETKKRAELIVNSLAEQLTDMLLYSDYAKIHTLINNYKQVDKDIHYIFVTDNHNRVIAHTFDNIFPKNLITANTPNNTQPTYKRIGNVNNREDVILDIAAPLLHLKIGKLRIGIRENGLKQKIVRANIILTSMIVLFLAVSIIAAYYFAAFLTKPVKRISMVSQLLNFNKIKPLYVDSKQTRTESVFLIYDELDVLIHNFNKMQTTLYDTHNKMLEIQKNLVHTEKLSTLGKLAANLAHEINNPLAGLIRCIERIQKTPENVEQTQKYTELMTDAAAKIQFVVQGLLNLGKKQELIFTKVDILKTLGGIIGLLQTELTKHKIKIQVNHPKNGALAKASQSHLEQVILNIAINAIDAIHAKIETKPQTQGTIEFSIVENQKYIILNITDNGIGIDEKDKEYIFDPFYSTKKSKKGNGLGLSISEKIVTELAGVLSFTSKNDEGTTFSIKLQKYQ